jgi:spermidine dehydrogenase
MSEIDRRDFLNGAALTLGVAAALSPRALLAADGSSVYPPVLTGMRGSHPGSFEVTHSMSWEGVRYGRADTRVDEPYDLIVVGGGLSGLAAARYFQRKQGRGARILIIDNHDDFGGHAKRNEFKVDGHHLIGYGGSQSIDTPSSYSPQAMRLLKDIGVETRKFYKYFDNGFYAGHDMGIGLYFDKTHYGRDTLMPCPASLFGSVMLGLNTVGGSDKLIKSMPLSDQGKATLHELVGGEVDYLEGKTDKEKIKILKSVSYSEFLRTYAKAPEEIVTLMDRSMAPLEALSWETVPAEYAAEFLLPGTGGLGLDGSSLIPMLIKSRGIMPDGLWRSMVRKFMKAAGAEPYIFHFPDGNASVARLLARKLMPHLAKGQTQEDVVKAAFDYEALDLVENNVRVRLNSTVVDVRHLNGGRSVAVSYVRNGRHERADGAHVILACNHKVIPFICEELREPQKLALDEAERAPLAYITVALRNWKAFAKAGIERIYAPQAMFSNMALDFPVSMGGVEFSKDPQKPILMHISYTPSAHLDAKGRTARELFKEGKHWLYVMSFDDFEVGIKAQMNSMLGPHGFVADRDIAAITVNRWPHGYAYYPMSLWDEYAPDDPRSANVIARQRHGRISIANSDAEYKAYVNGAFDAAHRAVKEQIGKGSNMGSNS